MTRPSLRAGFSLVELVVALTLLSVGLIALAGSAAVAQRAFAGAAAMELSLRAAAEVVDSLFHVPAPSAGSRTIGHVDVTWIVTSGGGVHRVFVRIEEPVAVEFEAVVPDVRTDRAQHEDP
jgi:prepilin-type N-terminal cleavage/methylation domain-containing protein